MNNAADIKISVIVPIRNKGPHLRRAIDSILKQEHQSFELILVDDNSSDNSMQIINTYYDPRIRVYSRNEPGPGGYAARNLAMEVSDCDWIAFLDADDEWSKEHLSSVAKLILEFPDAGLFTAGWISKMNDSEMVHPYFMQAKEKGTHLVSLYHYLRAQNQGMRLCCTPVIVANKSKILSVGGFPDGRAKKGGDLYLWIRMIQRFSLYYSPHMAATVYRDSVNMVTGSNLFEPTLFLGLIKDVKSSHDDKVTLELKKYIGKLLVKDYLTGIKRNNIKYFDIINSFKMHGIAVPPKLRFIATVPLVVYKYALKIVG